MTCGANTVFHRVGILEKPLTTYVSGVLFNMCTWRHENRILWRCNLGVFVTVVLTTEIHLKTMLEW